MGLWYLKIIAFCFYLNFIERFLDLELEFNKLPKNTKGLVVVHQCCLSVSQVMIDCAHSISDHRVEE